MSFDSAIQREHNVIVLQLVGAKATFLSLCGFLKPRKTHTYMIMNNKKLTSANVSDKLLESKSSEISEAETIQQKFLPFSHSCNNNHNPVPLLL